MQSKKSKKSKNLKNKKNVKKSKKKSGKRGGQPITIPYTQPSKGEQGGLITDREQLIIKQLNLIRKTRGLLKLESLKNKDEIEKNLNELEEAIEKNMPQRKPKEEN